LFLVEIKYSELVRLRSLTRSLDEALINSTVSDEGVVNACMYGLYHLQPCGGEIAAAAGAVVVVVYVVTRSMPKACTDRAPCRKSCDVCDMRCGWTGGVEWSGGRLARD
jgi:hypothetical protein